MPSERKTLGCYRQQSVHFGDVGVMKGVIDAAYVLTLEDKHRITNFLSRMQQFTPFGTIVVQYNKTYRHCKKPNVTTPDQDLRHAMAHCIRNALKRNEQRVLIMEDDCEFVQSQFTQENMQIVNEFLNKHDDVDAYLLGSIPMLSVPTEDCKHLRVHRGGGAHAMLWTQKGMRNFMRLVANTKKNGFVDTLITTTLRVYTPMSPYAVQKHPDTANSKNWMRGLDYVFHRHIFQSHIDGKCFYKWTHRCGRFGGTYVLLAATIVVCVAICVVQIKHELRRASHSSKFLLFFNDCHHYPHLTT